MKTKQSLLTKLLADFDYSKIQEMSNKRIRTIRKTYGLTQEAFSKLIMVNYETYCSWEKGRRTPSSPGYAILSIAEKYPKVFLENRKDIVKKFKNIVY